VRPARRGCCPPPPGFFADANTRHAASGPIRRAADRLVSFVTSVTGPPEFRGSCAGSASSGRYSRVLATASVTLAPIRTSRPAGDRYPPASMMAMVSGAMARKFSLTLSLCPSVPCGACQFRPRQPLAQGNPAQQNNHICAVGCQLKVTTLVGVDLRLFVYRLERASNAAGHRHGSSPPRRTAPLRACDGTASSAADLVNRRLRVSTHVKCSCKRAHLLIASRVASRFCQYSSEAR
jgi:hypothetical protein